MNNVGADCVGTVNGYYGHLWIGEFKNFEYAAHTDNPNFQGAIFSTEAAYGSSDDPPVYINVIVDPSAKLPAMTYLSQLAIFSLINTDNSVHSNEKKQEIYNSITRAMSVYYMIGDTNDVIISCKAVLDMTVKHIDDDIVEIKRAGIDKTKEFENRLDAYNSSEPLSHDLIVSLDMLLRSSGYAGIDASGRRLISHGANGIRSGTSVAQLEEAIGNLDASLRSIANQRFENVATQLWGWEYYKLSPAEKEMILDDYRSTQAILSTHKENVPNPTIRMLWHFMRNKIPYNIAMFKLPKNQETWTKNISKLELVGGGDPRHPLAYVT